MVDAFTPLRALDRSRASAVVIFTSHNRRETTLAALRSLAAQDIEDLAVGVVVVDDGSTDGTAEAVRAEFPSVDLNHGDGELYWVGGMARAMEIAIPVGADHIVWLNDDVVLRPTAISELLACSDRHRNRALCAGAFRDPVTGSLTYSGFRRRGRSPLGVELVAPTDSDERIDTINGNFVAIPRAVYEDVGGLDRRLVHLGGDIDYGYTAVEHGFGAVLAPGWMGTCSRHERPPAFSDPSRSLGERLKSVTSPKQMPLSAGIALMRKHSGPAWPARVARVYARAYWSAFTAR